MQTITVGPLAEKQQQGSIELIDVRTPVEYREVHAVGARNIPLDTLNPADVMASRQGAADEPLYLVCRSGGRSAKACQKFIDAGFENVVSVDGGTSAWDLAGHPVQRGKKTMGLERQVRTLAGFLILVGAILTHWVHPFFVAIPAFMGAGLLFAGITDTCGMGMMLSKMPWNQVKTSCSTETSCSIK